MSNQADFFAVLFGSHEPNRTKTRPPLSVCKEGFEPLSKNANDIHGSRVTPTETEPNRTEPADPIVPISSLEAAGNGGPRGVAPTGGPALRCYQATALTAVEAEWARGIRRTLLELPTGTGKTVCFAELARRVVADGKRALVVAHRTELLEQAARKLADVGVHAAIEQAGRRARDARVVVASVQTLRGARLLALDPADFGLLVIDEGHHATSASYRAILDRFAGVPTLLVTATPDRGDGVGLRAVVESVAYRYALRDAIRDKWLVPIRARRIVVAGLDLSQVHTHHGDFDTRELAEVMQRENHLHGMVGPLLEQAGSRPTIAFCVDVAAAHTTAEFLNRYRSGCARAVDGSAKDDERREVLAAFRRGEFQFLVNCALYTEGFDEPSIACVAMLRPTQSRTLHCQMLGRGTRLLGDSYEASVAAGKRDLVVVDFVGNVGKHRLVSPADALAGAEIPEELVEEVERELERGQLDLEEILAGAEATLELKRERKRLIVLQHYRAIEVDPFMTLGPDPDGPWTKEPATEKQRRALTDAGFKGLPADLTRGEASRYVDAMIARKKAGFCTLKAAQRLNALGLNTIGMTHSRAAQLFQKLRMRGWGKWTVQHEPEFRRHK